MDAIQSFTYLDENVPQWIARLEELLGKCETQYERFTRITQRGEIKLTRKKKQASTESLRPKQEEDAPPSQQPSNLNEVRTAASMLGPSPGISGTHIPHTKTPTQEIPRKRPAGSELSAAASNHCRYRTKNMVIVFYDSDVQDAFEGLVKSIAAARNNLRKGKNTTNFKLRMANMGAGPFGLDRSDNKMEGLAINPKGMGAPALPRARPGKQSAGSELRCFVEADHDLEEAQSFCEKGAHQFLRDGDCFSEIEGTRKRFLNCKSIAQRELERLEREAGASKIESSEQGEAEEERTLVGDATPPADQTEAKSFEITVAAKVGPPPLNEVKFAGSGAIEIDDGSDSESVQIDMSAIRRTVRSTRV